MTERATARSSERILVDRFKRAGRWAAACVVALGLVTTAIVVLQPESGLVVQMPLTSAVSTIFLGLALAIGRERHGFPRLLTRTLAAFIGAIALLSILDAVLGPALRHGELLFGGLARQLPFGAMPPQTALTLGLFSIALFTAPHVGFGRHVCDAAIVGVAAMLHAVMSPYFFYGLSLSMVTSSLHMTPLMVVALSLSWASLLFARADIGLGRLLSGDGAGSAVIRYLLPPTMVFPIAFACLRLWGAMAGWQPAETVLSTFATFQSLMRVTVLVVLGYALNRSEARRKEERARREQAERMVAMCAWTGRVRVNGKWVPVDQFLSDRFGLEVTHGISDEALAEQLEAIDETAAEDAA